MARFKIPITASRRKRYLVDLGGVSFTLVVRQNGAANSVYLDLRDSAGDPIALGIRAVTNQKLLEPLRYLTGLPTGELFVHDSEDEGVDPTFDTLGDRHLLIYEDAA